MKHTKIAIIGAGRVGTTTAYALMLKNIAAEILLVDVDPIRCKGEFLDLEDVIPLSSASKVCDAHLSDAAKADIIIITAGIAQKPGQTRTELLQTNLKVIDGIAQGLNPINPNAIIIVVSNPLDILALHLRNKKILPENQIFGSGTFLDSMRLAGLLAHKFNVSPKAIHAWILGEHGDSQMVAWSSAAVDGTSMAKLNISPQQLDDLAKTTRQKGYDIISCKGSTFYGIASCVAAICESIIFDQRKIFPISTYLTEYKLYMSMPCIIGQTGVEGRFTIELNPTEKEQLKKSAEKLKSMI